MRLFHHAFAFNSPHTPLKLILNIQDHLYLWWLTLRSVNTRISCLSFSNLGFLWLETYAYRLFYHVLFKPVNLHLLYYVHSWLRFIYKYFLFLLQLLISILNFEYDIVLEINALGFMALPGTCNIAGSFLFHND